MTIADIARAAKVSQGLIYHYFANKEAVICELLEHTMQSEADVFQQTMQSDEPPSRRLEALITSMLQTRHQQANPFGIAAQAAKGTPTSGNNLEIMRRIFANLKDGDSEVNDLRELMLKRVQSVHDVMVKLIAEGQKNGEFAQEPPAKLALMIFQCIQGLATLALERPEEYERHYPYTGIIMRMLKPGSH